MEARSPNLPVVALTVSGHLTEQLVHCLRDAQLAQKHLQALLSSRAAGPSSAKKRHLSAAPCGPAGWLHRRTVWSAKLEGTRSVTAWVKLQQGVKGAVSWGTCLPWGPHPAGSGCCAPRCFFSSNLRCVLCGRGQTRHLESICAALASVKNPPLLQGYRCSPRTAPLMVYLSLLAVCFLGVRNDF